MKVEVDVLGSPPLLKTTTKNEKTNKQKRKTKGEKRRKIEEVCSLLPCGGLVFPLQGKTLSDGIRFPPIVAERLAEHAYLMMSSPWTAHSVSEKWIAPFASGGNEGVRNEYKHYFRSKVANDERTGSRSAPLTIGKLQCFVWIFPDICHFVYFFFFFFILFFFLNVFLFLLQHVQ